MSGTNCGSENAIKMLDEMNLAYLIIDRDHCIKASGKSFRPLARSFGFERGISVYSDEIGIFDEDEIRPLIESVFISGCCVSSLRIDIDSVSGEKKHFNSGFYPMLSSNGSCSSVILKISDDTANIRTCESINELNRRLHCINEIISISASHTEPAEIINLAVRKTVELLNFDAGAFYSLDGDSKTAAISSYYGLYDLFFPPVIAPESGFYPYKSIYIDKKAVYAEQYLGAPHREDELGAFSMACIPVMAGDEITGSLNLATSSFHRFTLYEKETLEALGRQIGGVIRLANLQKSLTDANYNANLYLDIMMHDINNANLVSAGYLGLINGCRGKEAEYAKKALCGVEQSIEIIKNVSVIRALREKKEETASFSLDDVIKKEISHFPDVNIRYSECCMSVLCDGLLAEVFVNLFGNSVKFGGSDVCIDVTTEDKGEFIEVSVADNGPGIPDDIKPVIFDRLFKGKLKKTGKGLGLSIVRMVLERYGSSITVKDRICGIYSSGAKFTFSLKKA